MSHNWLVRFVPSFSEFAKCEIEFILKYTKKDYKINPVDDTDAFVIINCSKEQVDSLADRSIFVKSISLIINDNIDSELISSEIPLTAKIEIINFQNDSTNCKKSELIEEYLHLINQYKIDLDNPDIILQIFKIKDKTYKALFYKNSDRKNMLNYRISERPLIGITCMDWELSIFMANICGVKDNDIVIDPYVGSGGVALGPAWFNAKTLGMDFDIKSFIGSNDRKGNVKTNLKGNAIYDNFDFINKKNHLLGIIVGDIFNPPFKKSLIVDAVICDPPYGDRISLKGNQCTDYLKILKKFCDVYLKIGGCLCFWAPFYSVDYIDKIFHPMKREVFLTQELRSVTRNVYLYRKNS